MQANNTTKHNLLIIQTRGAFGNNKSIAKTIPIQ
jgi:hypothetical protein